MIFEDRLKLYIKDHHRLIDDLQRVRDLNLPECFIAAGYIRNMVWDRLHDYDDREKHTDIDVVYFDPEDISEQRDRFLENYLINQTGNNKWSVKNQVRMHVKNGDPPYQSTEEAIAHWPETVTAIGARLDDNNNIEVLAPYGLEDLFHMVVRKSPLFKDTRYFLDRIEKKKWIMEWPKLKLIDEPRKDER